MVSVEWLKKAEEVTDPEFGKAPSERTMEERINNSVIVIDKQRGPTSHQVTAWVRKIFGVSKAGHVGTLDPAVTGVLPVALGNATKAMPALMGIDKEYVGVMHLHKDVDEKSIRDTAAHFVGTIKQLPPVKAAVARKKREREIYFFDVIEIEGRDVLFRTRVQAGTYIRKLCHDIGLALRTGAHMSGLRRTRAGSFVEERSHSLVDVKDAYEFWKEGDAQRLKKMLIPVEHAIPNTKKIFVKDSAIGAVSHGSPLYASGITRVQKGILAGELVAIYSIKEELVALGIAKKTSEQMMKSNRGVAVRTDRVFIKPGSYPSKD